MTVLGKQYDGYEPIAGTHIKGQLTIGENIGDLGGVEMAYAAFQRYQARHGKAPTIGALTGDQRFFLAWAQVWQEKDREGALRQQLLTNAHGRRCSASTASCATSTPGTPRSASSPATNCISRRRSACTSGERSHLIRGRWRRPRD